MAIEQLLHGKVRDLARTDLQRRRHEEAQRRAAEETRRRDRRAAHFHVLISNLFGFQEEFRRAFIIPLPADRITIQGYEFFLSGEENAERLAVAISCPDCGERFERAEVNRLADVGELDEELAAHYEQEHPQPAKSEDDYIL